MINNFEQIRKLLTFPDKNAFYFLEIIKRRKENPEMERHASLVRDFYIYSLEEFDELEGKIIELCEINNARAYFRLNLRDAKKIAFQFNKRLAELLITEDYKAIPKCYASVVGEFHADPDKKWLIDIDGSREDLDYEVTSIVLAIDKITGDPDTVIAKIRTKNGYHLITKPFRLDTFRGEFPKVEVHKDNPTILHIP